MKSKISKSEKDAHLLALMCEKNRNILPFLRRLDLISVDEETGKVSEPMDIEILFNQKQKSLKEMSSKRKFKNEVEVPQMKFADFKKDDVQVFYHLSNANVDFRDGKGEQEMYTAIPEDGSEEDRVMLPNHYKLTARLKALMSIKKDELEDTYFEVTQTGKDGKAFEYSVKY